MKRNYKDCLHLIGFHCAVLLMGFVKVLYGAAVAGLITLAVFGFSAVSTEDGYVAVCDFIAAIATLAVALSCTYAFGCRRKKKCRYGGNG